jgi:hypothetical protein
MKGFDRYLRNVRIAKARNFVKPGDTVIDVGCADGEMFESWSDLIAFGYGVDPIVEGRIDREGYSLFGGHFPDALPAVKADVITMLAVIEHLPPAVQAQLSDACSEILNLGGRVVITVPSPQVDAILEVLQKLRMIDGMSIEEHYGFDPGRTPHLFPPPRFRLLNRKSFQFGLNNLFVFEKCQPG